LFRSIGAEQTPTLLWDEVDTVFGPKAPSNEGLRGILDNGYTRGKPFLPLCRRGDEAAGRAVRGVLPEDALRHRPVAGHDR
jgi:hypothetical protein